MTGCDWKVLQNSEWEGERCWKVNVFITACIDTRLVQDHRNQQFTGGKITPVLLQDHRGQQFTGGESRSALLQDQGGQQFTGGQPISRWTLGKQTLPSNNQRLIRVDSIRWPMRLHMHNISLLTSAVIQGNRPWIISKIAKTKSWF